MLGQPKPVTKWHGWRESNSHKAVLETAVLPIYHIHKMARDRKLSLDPCLAESSTVQRAHTGSICSIASLLWLGSSFTLSSLFSRPKTGNQPRLPYHANWCARQDLNLHALRQRLLRPSCMPFHH